MSGQGSSNLAQPQAFPQIGQRFVDENGQVTRAWHQFLVSLWNRTGGSTGRSVIDLPALFSQDDLNTLQAIPDGDLLANISGTVAVPVGVAVSAYLDYTLGSSQGDILYRDASAWKVLSPGTSGQFLETLGAAANPAWATISATALLDAIGSTQGDILYRNASAWVVLAPGTAGQILQTGGGGANPSWVTNAGGTSATALTFVNGTTFSIGAVMHNKADQTATLTTGQALRLAMMAPTHSGYGFAVVDPNNTAHGYLGNTQADGNVVTYRGTAGSTLALGASGNTGVLGAFGTAYHKQEFIFSHDGTNIGVGYAIDEGANGCGQSVSETDANAIGRTGLLIGVACGGNTANITAPYMNIATTIGGI